MVHMKLFNHTVNIIIIMIIIIIIIIIIMLCGTHVGDISAVPWARGF